MMAVSYKNNVTRGWQKEGARKDGGKGYKELVCLATGYAVLLGNEGC